MIQLAITKTARGYHPSQLWRQYDHTTENFPDLKAAKAWIKEKYGTSKKSPMYIDTKTGKTKKIGYVIGFRSEEYEDGKWDKFLEQHWVSFSEVKDMEF